MWLGLDALAPTLCHFWYLVYHYLKQFCTRQVFVIIFFILLYSSSSFFVSSVANPPNHSDYLESPKYFSNFHPPPELFQESPNFSKNLLKIT